jgi:type IV pilus assembly protein PilB
MIDSAQSLVSPAASSGTDPNTGTVNPTAFAPSDAASSSAVKIPPVFSTNVMSSPNSATPLAPIGPTLSIDTSNLATAPEIMPASADVDLSVLASPSGEKTSEAGKDSSPQNLVAPSHSSSPLDAPRSPAVIPDAPKEGETGTNSAAPATPPVVPQGVPALNGVPSHGSILEILVEQKLLTQAQVDALTLEQANSGKQIEALIEEKNLVSEVAMTQAKALLYGIPFAQLNDIGVSPEAISQIPESVARRYQILPFMINKVDHVLSVAMKNPLDLSAIDFTSKKTGFTLKPYFATPSEIERTIAERYAQNLSSEVNAALKETKQANQSSNLQNLSVLSKEVVREAPITRIVETILGYAVKARASDVHIEPQEDRTRVRYRVDGILGEKLILPRTVHDAVLSRVKILSGMKIDEKRLPQDGRFTFTADGEEVDLRVSTLPTVHGEKVVMRLLKKNASVPTLGDLGLRGNGLRDVEESIRVPHGIVLITGPTGSGKTTTLYSILHQINTPKVNISTLEDPVEYQMPGINQVQVNPQAGLTFASGLRAFLRQDPNIIMVGEIRDHETAELAIQASLTGHLVFSTLHTNSAAGALPRLLDMGAEPFLLASSLTLALAQRVVRKINPEYKEPYTPSPMVVADIKKVLGPLYTAWCTQNKQDPDKVTLWRAKADRPQTEPEYKDRMAIFEVMKITDEIARMLLEKKSAADIEKAALSKGMLLMKQDGYIKALEGVTTIEEVLRVAEV